MPVTSTIPCSLTEGDESCCADINGFLWSKTSRGCQLGVQRTAAPVVQFLGFRDDVSLLPVKPLR